MRNYIPRAVECLTHFKKAMTKKEIFDACYNVEELDKETYKDMLQSCGDTLNNNAKNAKGKKQLVMRELNGKCYFVTVGNENWFDAVQFESSGNGNKGIQLTPKTFGAPTPATPTIENIVESKIIEEPTKEEPKEEPKKERVKK